jgi:hypothetical protein
MHSGCKPRQLAAAIMNDKWNPEKLIPPWIPAMKNGTLKIKFRFTWVILPLG